VGALLGLVAGLGGLLVWQSVSGAPARGARLPNG
jgi:hypothetical protein